MRRRLTDFLRSTRAATAVEYGLIVALIVIAIMAGIATLGSATGTIWGNMTVKVAAAMPVS